MGNKVWCSACNFKAKRNTGQVARHHLHPKGMPGWRHNTKKGGNIKTIHLCINCHQLVHTELGEGHTFRGPTTKRHLIRWIRLKKNLS